MRSPRLALIGLVVCILVIGCSRLQTVTVPAQQPTINAVTDTVHLQEYPPLDVDGTPTEPAERTLIADTASTPAIDVQRVEVDRRPDEGQVRFLWEEGRRTVRDAYDMPVYGEMLVWRPEQVDRRGFPVRSTDRRRDTPADTVRDTVTVRPLAELVGSPQERRVQADVTTAEPPWYRTLWTWIRIGLAFLVGAACSYVVVKLIPGL